MLTIAILALLCLVVGGVLVWKESWRDVPPEHVSERDYQRVTERPRYHGLVERTTQDRQRQAVKAISEWRQR